VGGGKKTGNKVVMYALWKPGLPRKGEVNLNKDLGSEFNERLVLTLCFLTLTYKIAGTV
jgi:hypothetical protein